MVFQPRQVSALVFDFAQGREDCDFLRGNLYTGKLGKQVCAEGRKDSCRKRELGASQLFFLGLGCPCGLKTPFI